MREGTSQLIYAFTDHKCKKGDAKRFLNVFVRSILDLYLLYKKSNYNVKKSDLTVSD